MFKQIVGREGNAHCGCVEISVCILGGYVASEPTYSDDKRTLVTAWLGIVWNKKRTMFQQEGRVREFVNDWRV